MTLPASIHYGTLACQQVVSTVLRVDPKRRSIKNLSILCYDHVSSIVILLAKGNSLSDSSRNILKLGLVPFAQEECTGRPSLSLLE